MTIHTASKHLFKLLAALGLIAALAACGGGGSSNSGPSDPAPDTSPAAFTLLPVVDVAVNTDVSSAPVSITDINQATPISITGGTYSIAGGAFTNVAGTVSNGQSVVVKVTSSSATNTPVEAVLTVGGITGSFKVTTKLDTTPDAFTLAAITDAAVNTEVSSAAVNVTGIDQAVPISISGGTYSIAGGAFTNAAGTISNGQSVIVKVTSSSATNTPVEAVVTIGGVTGNFKVTTKPDVTPNDFSFTPPATGVVPKSVNTSSAITVDGIDIAVPISISGGEYAINDGAFTSTAGTVSKTQTVKVRGTASTNLSTNTSVELTVGGVKGSYVITTLADTVAPTAQILFPPPVSMTEGNTILVRGTASDDYSTVISVKVNNIEVTPKAAGDYSSWQINAQLTASIDNNITVTTKDSAGNESTNVAKVIIHQGAVQNGFPDGNRLYSDPSGLALDQLDGRSRLLVADVERNQIISVDLSTGKSSLFVKTTAAPNQVATVIVDSTNKRLYAPAVTGGIVDYDLLDPTKYNVLSTTLYKVSASSLIDNLDSDLKIVTADDSIGRIVRYSSASQSFSILSDASVGIPDSENPINSAQGLVLDRVNTRYLVLRGGWEEPDANKHTVYSIDRITGARKILSSNSTSTGEFFSGLLANQEIAALSCSAVDEINSRLIVPEAYTGKIFSVDLNTGNRRLISDPVSKGILSSYTIVPESIVIHGSNNYALIGSYQPRGIYAVDLVTGEQVIISN